MALQIVEAQIKKANGESRSQDAKELQQVEDFLRNFLEQFSS